MFADNLLVTVSLALLAGVTLLSLPSLYRYTTRACSLNHLPGPPPRSWILGSARDLRAARVGTRYNVWRKQYGPVYMMRGVFMRPILVLADPKGINHVLHGKSTAYPRPELDRVALELWFGKSVLCCEGEEHKATRKILNKAFTTQAVEDVSGVFFELAHRLCSRWEDLLQEQSVTLEITEHLHSLTLDAISMTMFAHDLSASKNNIPDLLKKISNGPGDEPSTFTELMGVLVDTFPILLKLPNPISTWVTMLRTELGAIARDAWAASKAGSVHGMDAKMLELLDSHVGDGFTEQRAVAEIIAVLFAGSETSANVMSEFLFEIAHHDDIQTKMREELGTFEAKYQRRPNFEDLMSSTTLPYFDAVVKETLRLKAVLMDISRVAAEDDVIPLDVELPGTQADHVYVKKGTDVWIPVRDGVNVDKAIWGSDAAEFKPERWLSGDLPDSVRAIRAQGNVLTFGDGPKTCLGRTFAIAEIKIVLSIVIQQFSFAPDKSTLDFYHLGGNTVKPKVRGEESAGVQLPLQVTKL